MDSTTAVATIVVARTYTLQHLVYLKLSIALSAAVKCVLVCVCVWVKVYLKSFFVLV